MGTGLIVPALDDQVGKPLLKEDVIMIFGVSAATHLPLPVIAMAPGGGPLDIFIPLIFMIPIFYFLIIRPQNKRMKEQRAMVEGAKKGDVVVTSGGLVGKVTKSKEGEPEIEVEIAKDVRVTVVRSTLADVRQKD